MTRAGGAWWAARIRQFRAHIGARVDPDERTALTAWLTPSELAIFDAMHVADRRHGLDVVATLRQGGIDDRDVLVAGLIHDAAKGDTGVLPRVLHALGSAYGTWIPSTAAIVPGLREPLRRLRDHAGASAELAAAAGCPPRTVELIRWQDEPRDVEYGERLRLADEAN